MLRITLPACDDDPVFTLEGRLAGEWVQELIRVTRQIPPGTSCVFDIDNVFYVDSLGEETLLWLNRLGATFITRSAYGRNLCQRLHLSRISARPADPSAHNTEGSAQDIRPPSFRPRRPPS